MCMITKSRVCTWETGEICLIARDEQVIQTIDLFHRGGLVQTSGGVRSSRRTTGERGVRCRLHLPGPDTAKRAVKRTARPYKTAYKIDLLWEALRALNRPRRAQTAENSWKVQLGLS